MSNNGEHIIEQIKFLGIEFYKRTRLEEHTIQISAQQNITTHPGLLVVGKDFFTHSPLSSPGPNWVALAYRTIELTLLDLIINEFIDLIVFTDTKFYLYDLFRNEYQNYRLITQHRYQGNDNLSASIIKSIQLTNQRKQQQADLKTVIRHLLDEYLGENHAHSQPHKAFIIELIQRYNWDYSWITLKIHPRVFFQSQSELAMPTEKREELKKAYTTLSDITVTLNRGNKAFHLYTNEFYRVIKSEFERRKPHSD